MAVEQDLARLDDARACATRPQDGQRGDALAAAGLADQAQDLAPVDVEVDAGDGPDHAVARVERRPQAAHLEQLAGRRGDGSAAGAVALDASSVEPRVERVAEAVAEQVEAEHGQGQGDAREEQQVRRGEDAVALAGRS